MTEQEGWVAAEEVAAHLGIQKPTVYRWIRTGGLPAHRMGRLLRFKLSEVDGWAKARDANEGIAGKSEGRSRRHD